MLVAVGSKNPVKIEAVKLAFKKVWPNENWEFVVAEVDSGVSDQPMKNSESIYGARNRAKKALVSLNADYGVGLEAGLQRVRKNWYEQGWCCVVDDKGVEGIGSSISLQVPNVFMDKIFEEKEMDKVIEEVLGYGYKDLGQREGFFGLMTNNLLNRTEAYCDGVISALAIFINPYLFESTECESV